MDRTPSDILILQIRRPWLFLILSKSHEHSARRRGDAFCMNGGAPTIWEVINWASYFKQLQSVAFAKLNVLLPFILV
jgi:hypothetical protein